MHNRTRKEVIKHILRIVRPMPLGLHLRLYAAYMLALR